MKRLLSLLTILAAVMLTSSCQKELPDNLNNIDVTQGDQTPTPTPTPTPDNPTEQGGIPSEGDIIMPGY